VSIKTGKPQYGMKYLESFQLYILWKLLRLAKEEPRRNKFFLFDFLTYFDHYTCGKLYYVERLLYFCLDSKKDCDRLLSFVKSIFDFFDKLKQNGFIKSCRPTVKKNLNELFGELKCPEGKNDNLLGIQFDEVAGSNSNSFIIEFSDDGTELIEKCLECYLNLFIGNKLHKFFLEGRAPRKSTFYFYLEEADNREPRFFSYEDSADFFKKLFWDEYKIYRINRQVIGIWKLIQKKWAMDNRDEEVAGLDSYAKEDFINNAWHDEPIIRPIETLLAMEKEGNITICEMNRESVTVELIYDFVLCLQEQRLTEHKCSGNSVRKRYTYDPNQNKISWDNGEFAPESGVGIIFQALFERRAIIKKDKTIVVPAKPISLEEIEKLGIKYSNFNIQIRKVISNLNKEFSKKQLPFKIPKAKDGHYHLEQREDESYELVELELRK
jgi:hypothetical protein